MRVCPRGVSMVSSMQEKERRRGTHRLVISPLSTVELRSFSANESKNVWMCSVQYSSFAPLSPGILCTNREKRYAQSGERATPSGSHS